MTKRPHLRAVPSPKAGKNQPAIEWLGGRLQTSIGVQEEGRRFYLELVLWVELPSGLILATTALEPGTEPDACAIVLQQAMASPAAGPPRVPDRIRVRTNNDAVVVASVLPAGVSLVVDPVPEFDAILADFEHAVPAKQKEASYFDDGVSKAALSTLFAAAFNLYRAAPWKTGYDCDLLRVDVPELGVVGACISILGANAEVFGFSLFDSLDDYDEFVDATGRMGDPDSAPRGPRDFGAAWQLLSFERGADLPKKMRGEVREHGWPLAGAKAYPRCGGHDRSGALQPLDDRDLLRLSICADAVAAFTTAHPHAFRDLENDMLADEGITMRHHGAGLPACVVTFPYDPEFWAAGRGDDAGDPDEEFPDPAAAIREYKARHYASWPDVPLPALAGRTPRFACRTKAGRRDVEMLLRDMEQHEAALPELERYDFKVVRGVLGLG